MDKETELEKVGIAKPTYEEIENEYGRMASRCEYAEDLNKSLERIIVEKDNTIESLTNDIEDYERIVREKVKIIEALTDENKELKVELAKVKQEQLDYMLHHRPEGTINLCNAYKDFDRMSVTDVIVARLKDAKEIVNLADHKKWEVVVVNGDDICTQRMGYKNITKYIFHVSDYRKTWIFVDDKEVKSNEHDNS